MENELLSLFQALQLLALGPCLFIVAFLVLTVRKPTTIAAPAFYFLSLAAGFLLPLLPVLDSSGSQEVRGALLFIESLIPALSFLVIVQFIHLRPPAPVFWLVLAIPGIGGSSFIYGMLHFDELCLWQSYCLPAASLKTMYHLVGSGMIFLLLTVYYSRQRVSLPRSREKQGHRYWLIMAMIILNLLLMAVNLAEITDRLSAEAAWQVETLIRIGFVYLVLTSLFRIFDGSIEVDTNRIPTLAKSRSKPEDGWIIEKIERTMSRDYAYRECATLLALAEKLSVPEHQLSRVINTHYGVSFSDFINQHRIGEAKHRLCTEPTAVTTIAYEVGFGSIATFNRVFREKTGMTPSAYRKEKAQTEPITTPS